jgi:hypothetical protein
MNANRFLWEWLNGFYRSGIRVNTFLCAAREPSMLDGKKDGSDDDKDDEGYSE